MSLFGNQSNNNNVVSRKLSPATKQTSNPLIRRAPENPNPVGTTNNTAVYSYTTVTDVRAFPLSCLLSPERTKDTEQVRNDLVTRGWTFLYKDVQAKLELPTTEEVKILLDAINSGFFNKEKEKKEEYKQVVYPANRFGYFSTGRKEGYRFATGTKLREFVLPCVSKPSMMNRVKEAYIPFHVVAASCDEVCIQIFRNQGQYLFSGDEQPSANSQFTSYTSKRIPLFNGKYQPHKLSKMDYYYHEPSIKDESRHSFGLFDIVKYLPKSKFPEDFSSTNSQVNEHADPGLFSLSLGSTAEGLEMFDASTKEWVKVPSNVMVLWCGHAVTDASGGKVKPGVHRVVANENERLTCWYEVCIDAQVPQRRFDLNDETIAREKQLWLDEYWQGISMSKSGRPSVSHNQMIKGISLEDMNLLASQSNNKSGGLFW